MNKGVIIMNDIELQGLLRKYLTQTKSVIPDQSTDMPYITRVEVIDEKGRAYTRRNLKDVVFHFQDNGRTLKIFIKEGGNNEKNMG